MKQLFAAVAIVAVLAGGALAQSGRTTGEKVDDAQITAKVKAKLVADRASSLVKVNVDTHDGIVRLQGTVPTDADRAEAERLAMGTEGVKSVTNDLKVATGGSASPRR
jgi:osmotically-inducible protein OsmY